MGSRTSPAVLGILLGLIAVPAAHAQPRDVRLPEPDPTIQKWLTALASAQPPRQGDRAEFYKEYFAQMAEVATAKQQGTVTDEAWLTQSLLFGCQKGGQDAWVNAVRAMGPYALLGASSLTAMRTLAPYLDSKDPMVAGIAREMISYSIIFEGKTWNSALESHLRSTLPGEPSWKLVFWFMGDGTEPDDVWRVVSKVYFDEATQQQLERTRKELTILLYSYDLATAADQKADWSKKITAKLDELAKHPHWSIRAYVLARILNARRSPHVLIGGAHWSRDEATVAITARLSEDSNPAVVELAKAVLRVPQVR